MRIKGNWAAIVIMRTSSDCYEDRLVGQELMDRFLGSVNVVYSEQYILGKCHVQGCREAKLSSILILRIPICLTKYAIIFPPKLKVLIYPCFLISFN